MILRRNSVTSVCVSVVSICLLLSATSCAPTQSDIVPPTPYITFLGTPLPATRPPLIATLLPATPTPVPIILAAHNADQMKLVGMLGHGSIVSMHWSDDRKTLVLASPSGISVYDYSLHTVKLRKHWPNIFSDAIQHSSSLGGTGYSCRESLTTAEISSDGRLFAYEGEGNTVQIWDLSDGSLRQTIKVEGKYIQQMALSHDAREIVLTPWGNDVASYDIGSGKRIATFSLKGVFIRRMVFSSDSIWLASAGGDYIRIWDAKTGQLKRTMDGKFTAEHIFFALNDTVIAGIDFPDGQIRLWDPNSGKSLGALTTNFYAYDGVLSRDDHIVALINPRNAQLWDLETKQAISKLLNLPDHPAAFYTEPLMIFNDESQILLTSVCGGSVVAWDFMTEKTAPITGLEDYSSAIVSLDFSPDGQILASADIEGLIRIWDIRTGKLQRLLQAPVKQLAFSPDGRRLAGAGADGFWIWDIAQGQLLMSNPGNVTAISFEKSETLLVLGGTGIERWNTSTFQQESIVALRLSTSYTNDKPTFNEAGTALAAGSVTGDMWIWETNNAYLLQTFNRGSNAWTSLGAFSISPDTSLLVSAHGFGPVTINLWDVSTGAVARQIQDDLATVNLLSFSPDGQLLALAGANGFVLDKNAIHIWDPNSTRFLKALNGQTGIVSAMTFDPSGTLLASGSTDGTIRLWGIASR